MITVYGRATSSNVQLVMWTIAELGLTFERHDVGFVHGGNDTKEFLQMNPNGKIPVIRDGEGPPIFEAAAIARYLAGRYGDAPFWPQDPAERAQIDKWADWAKGEVVGAFTRPIFWQVVRTAPGERDDDAMARAVATLDRLLDIADAQLANQSHLAGEAFSLADVMLGHVLYRYFDVDIPRPNRPALNAYYERLSRRPAYAEHVMVPYEALRVR